ncbi:MAG: glycosyltransferase [Bacteroidetes bacterium]|nr:glycosyltransferase [Bacteroidota bacterium]
MKGVIIPFFNYGHGNSRIFYDFFKLHLPQWIKYVDNVYVIDSGLNLEQHPDPKVKIIRKPQQSHWQNMNEAIRQVPDDMILLMDCDTVIYKPEAVEFGFRMLEGGYDICSIFDSSGGVDLGLRNNYRRLAPYYCYLKKSSLRGNFDFTPIGGPEWMDSMGKITQEAVQDNRRMMFLNDDRSNIYLNPDGSITHEQWLDDKTIPENPDYGYYHMRNLGGALKIVSEKTFELVPPREANRLLVWLKHLANKTNTYLDFDYVHTDQFNDYYQHFINYYYWLKNI